MTVQVSNQNLEKNHQFITITVQCASIPPPQLCVDGYVCCLFDILEIRHNSFQDEVFGDDGPSAAGASAGIGIGANASSSASAGNDSGLGADEQQSNNSSSSNSAGVSVGSAPPQVCYIGIRALMERSLM